MDYKPGYVVSDHLSSLRVTTKFKRPTRNTAGRCMVSIRSCFEWGLQSLLCYQNSGELLPRLSTLTSQGEAVYFCCTGLGVASTGRYPALCPVKPGLSSPASLFSFDSIFITPPVYTTSAHLQNLSPLVKPIIRCRS